MSNWTKETPAVEGWYWIKYRVGNYVRKCPCYVTRMKIGISCNLVQTARNVSFFEGPNHGGWGLKCIVDGKVKLYKSIRFGPAIQEPKG